MHVKCDFELAHAACPFSCYNTRMTIDFADLLRRIPGYAHQIAHVQPLPPRVARFAMPATPLPDALVAALAARGITQLYAHQAAAINAARAGDHLGVVTTTASGKTLCYQLPALEAILAEPASRALFLFPTKALAHDQLRALNELLDALEPKDQRPTSTKFKWLTTNSLPSGESKLRKTKFGI